MSELDLSNLSKSMMGGGIKDSNPDYKSYEKKYGNNQRPNNNPQSGKKNFNGNQKNKGYTNKTQTSGYVGAPYNFIPFSNDVYEYPKQDIVPYNAMSEERLTGEIFYEITAKTPVIVDDGNQQFHKDAWGRYAIPGSTMRGLIRNNVQILGLCDFSDDIDDYELMYRDIQDKRYQAILGARAIRVKNGEKMQNVSVLENVKAGYVKKEHGKYMIYRTVVDSIKKEYGEMNYYVLSERKIINDYLKNKNKFSYEFFVENGKSKMQHIVAPFRRDTDRNNRIHYKGTANKDYQPYYSEISYEIANLKDVTAVGKSGTYKNEGYVISAGKMNEKKAIYIIPQLDPKKEPLEIPEKDIRAFHIDMQKRENTLKQFGGRPFFDLPEEGETKPVFYIELGGRLYFGFTPRLRLFYDFSIKQGLNKNHKSNTLDYSKMLFGYTTGKDSRKSRISFSDAVAEGTPQPTAQVKYILGEPKPSSYMDYVKQNGKNGPMRYDSDGFQLRGVKQYWLKEHTEKNAAEITNEKVATTLRPLPEGTKFTGKIRFQNLTREELGLLLWSVRLEKDSRMNIGKAKAYGYGNIDVEIKHVQKINMQQAYLDPNMLNLNPFENVDVDEMISCYKSHINQTLGKRTIDELPHIQDFFRMKDAAHIPDSKDTRYMTMEEYRVRRRPPLDGVEEVMKKSRK